jgi:hypothetical protein
MTRLQRLLAWSTPAHRYPDPWFPGPLIGGVALIAGPALWCLGLLLRYLPAHSDLFGPERWADLRDRPFAAPMELAMYEASPGFVLTGFAVFMLGALTLAFAYPALARIVATRSPCLTWWGASLVILGLFAQLYWAGAMWGGVLKESHLLDVLSSAACAVLAPIGQRLLRGRTASDDLN